MYGCLLHAPHWGPGLQPRYMPWRGIEPATLWFAGWCSIHWATPARAEISKYWLYTGKQTIIETVLEEAHIFDLLDKGLVFVCFGFYAQIPREKPQDWKSTSVSGGQRKTEEKSQGTWVWQLTKLLNGTCIRDMSWVLRDSLCMVASRQRII